ncbi:MAG: 2-amino-4-hydroxy-6-hydroxymethyldihydropteridine diphosphokinase [Candidatus Dadabacteria bacterium]|nr:2-amino-4-hydroxy-6-hydroxymethyldihydropteridine diphosphokinase [Candidatus Dadabacteria bacterium]
MAKAYIGIGSNMGERAGNCETALNEISKAASVLSVSSVYETEPVGPEPQRDFINAAAKIELDRSPYELLRFLQGLELSMGREGHRMRGPRVIDLDILFFDNFVISSKNLVVPHPRAHMRRFVLQPLCEVEPGLIHPQLKVTVSTLLSGLKDNKKVVKIGVFSTANS